MQYRLVILPAVQIDIREAVGLANNSKLGYQFVSRLREAYHFLEGTALRILYQFNH